jgi:hypothetical protein
MMKLYDPLDSNQQEKTTRPDTPDSLGGDQLEGSGFEEEIPEPASDWRIPQ